MQFVGSYIEPEFIGLIMSPVADMNLSVYLERNATTDPPKLRISLSYLATALASLHKQGIHHKDMKPGNVLVHCGIIIFADFGLSLGFRPSDGSTFTHLFRAPEVIDYEPRNTESDM